MSPRQYRVLVRAGASRRDWLEGRKVGIGASESAAVLGDTAWGSPLSVWVEKTADGVREIDSARMLWGRRLEPHIAAWSREDYPHIGRIVPALGLVQSRQHGHLLATLDYELVDRRGRRGALEIKNIDRNEKPKWQTDDGELVVPKPYQVQVQQQMCVRGFDWAYVQPFFGGNDLPEPILVERDDAYIEEFLVGEVGDFWKFHVVPRIPPPPRFGDRLWDVWPGRLGEVIDAGVWVDPETGEEHDIVDEVGIWRISVTDEKDAEKAKEQAAFRIAAFMGDATELRDPVTDEIIHTLRGQRTAQRVSVKELQERHPRIGKTDIVHPHGWARIHRATKAEI